MRWHKNPAESGEHLNGEISAHAKLFPMHGTKMLEWRPMTSKVDKYFEKYEGYISSHDYKRANDEKLSELAKKIRR